MTIGTELNVEDLRQRVEAFEEALTPSADTKYAYIGEFKMPLVRVDECGDEYTEHVTVSWDVIKEIMAAIKARTRTASSREGL